MSKCILWQFLIQSSGKYSDFVTSCSLCLVSFPKRVTVPHFDWGQSMANPEILLGLNHFSSVGLCCFSHAFPLATLTSRYPNVSQRHRSTHLFSYCAFAKKSKMEEERCHVAILAVLFETSASVSRNKFRDFLLLHSSFVSRHTIGEQMARA